MISQTEYHILSWKWMKTMREVNFDVKGTDENAWTGDVVPLRPDLKFLWTKDVEGLKQQSRGIKSKSRSRILK